MVVAAAKVAIGQEHHPPAAVGGLHKVAVARALDLHGLSFHVAVGEDGVAAKALVETIDVAAAGDGEVVGQLGATL